MRRRRLVVCVRRYHRSLPGSKPRIVCLASALVVESRVIREPHPHERARRALVITGGPLQRQRALIEADRFLVGIDQAGLIAGTQEVADRLLGLLGVLPVVGQQAELLLDALREEPLQRLGDPAMSLPTLALEQCVVGCLARQFVLEDELALRRAGAFTDQVVALQAKQMRIKRSRIVADLGQ